MSGLLAQALLGGVAEVGKTVNENWRDKVKTARETQAHKERGEFDTKQQKTRDQNKSDIDVKANKTMLADQTAAQASLYSQQKEIDAKFRPEQLHQENEAALLHQENLDALSLTQKEEVLKLEQQYGDKFDTVAVVIGEDGKQKVVPVDGMPPANTVGMFKKEQTSSEWSPVTGFGSKSGVGGSGSGSGKGGPKELTFKVDYGDGKFQELQVVHENGMYFMLGDDGRSLVPISKKPSEQFFMWLAAAPEENAEAYKKLFGESAYNADIKVIKAREAEIRQQQGSHIGGNFGGEDGRGGYGLVAQAQAQAQNTPATPTLTEPQQAIPSFEDAQSQERSWGDRWLQFSDTAEYYAKMGDWERVQHYAPKQRYEELRQKYSQR